MRKIALIAILLIALPARADMDAESIAKRVGQVFAGYNDFWVWVIQRETTADGREIEFRGRAYFKRDKMFRLNFGQPPTLVHGTDGEEYWIYDAEKKVVEFTNLDQNAPVHVLFGVFAAGDQMVRALDKFFNVDALEQVDYEISPVDATSEGAPATADKVRAYKLVLSLKPEQLKELREKGENQLTEAAKQRWTIFVDQKSYLPREIRVDFESGGRDVFLLGTFHNNIGLSSRLFKRPASPGVEVRKMAK